MLTRKETDVDRSKAWCANSKPMGNPVYGGECGTSWRNERRFTARNPNDNVHLHDGQGVPWLTNESAYQYLAVVDPDYPKQARDIIDQLTEKLREVRELVHTKRNDHHFIQEEDRAMDWKRMCGHDVWSKHSRTRHDKAIIIRRLQASINKLKATLLEKGHAVRASEETNTKLTVAVSCAQRRCKAWMITTAITLLTLLTIRQLWEEGHGEVLHGSPKDVRQTLIPQGSDIAVVEAHRAASQCEKVHEDHRKYAAVMATAKPLPLSECYCFLKSKAAHTIFVSGSPSRPCLAEGNPHV
ncbi:hypothetical protein Cgig2_007622 [Carnegiea gigantea]|uniref:Uncharacterized protein n=1 Tax=Carnegiea gigantea TaxID=171969 RepID=A0A9Q1JP71_9CARY|nr:hypothetical protein Cgig2_007622 [Carnegiea gigantea]